MPEDLPETRYAESGEVSIAYQVMGQGERDLIVMPGLFSNIDTYHELPGYTVALRQLSAFARVITFDKRGQGLSDRITGVPSLEERVGDLRAVMSAAGAKKVALLGCSDGGTMAMLFAASYSEDTVALILFGAYAKACAANDYPHMAAREERWARIRSFSENLGKGNSLNILAPELASDDDVRALYGKAERSSTTPKSLFRYFNVVIDTDLRSILPSIRVPTLVLHHRDDPQVPFAAGQHLAESIDGARLVDLGMGGHGFWSGNSQKLADHIQSFLTGEATSAAITDRVLATVMFTDIVESTANLAEVGDTKWREILNRHDDMAAQLIRRHRGRIIKNTGDGVLAVFDGPGRAIQCAIALAAGVDQFGIEVRAGIHTGEVETRGDDVSGIAVHTAARIMAEAQPGEVLTSGIVSALVAGSELFEFADRGTKVLKGIPGALQIFSAKALLD